MEFVKRTWAEIDLDALKYNIDNIKASLKGKHLLMGIVKADAYGHGDGIIAKKLAENGFDWFGVSNVEEGISLRKQGITQPILILGYTPVECAKMLSDEKITQAIISLDYAKALNAEAEKAGVVVDGHIKLDTGMTRVGFQCDDDNFQKSLESITEVFSFKNIHITGTFTHHAVADTYSGDCPQFTEMQFDRFQRMIKACQQKGLNMGICHCANSATTISYPEKQLDMVRSGIITYGMLPSDECEGRIDLKPLMTLKTSIALVKKVEAGAQISYGRTYTADKERLIATVPIGYADGYNRNLSNRACMLVHGKRAPIVGRVCMDQLMIDVTDIPDVKMGDEVVVFGKQGDAVLPIEELANMLNTINYEIPCVITKRVPRVYYEGGKLVGVVNHVMHRYE